MQYDVASPAEYLEQLPDDWRRAKVASLRETILRLGPELTERIDYKMLAFGDADNVLFHLNAQKNYVSLYVGNASVIDPDGVLLKGLNVGKGCVRFTKSVDVAATRIDEFIERAIDMRRQGYSVDC